MVAFIAFINFITAAPLQAFMVLIPFMAAPLQTFIAFIPFMAAYNTCSSTKHCFGKQQAN